MEQHTHVVFAIVVSAFGELSRGCSREQRLFAFLHLVCILLVRDRSGISGLIRQPGWYSLLRAIKAYAFTSTPLGPASREQRLILRFRVFRSGRKIRCGILGKTHTCRDIGGG